MVQSRYHFSLGADPIMQPLSPFRCSLCTVPSRCQTYCISWRSVERLYQFFLPRQVCQQRAKEDSKIQGVQHHEIRRRPGGSRGTNAQSEVLAAARNRDCSHRYILLQVLQGETET